MRNVFSVLKLATMVPLAFATSGCVVFDIRNELKSTNQRMDRIQTEMDDINKKLETSNKSLASINDSMEPIRISLRRIDDELHGMLETINNVGKFVPGVKPDQLPPKQQEPTQETTPQKK